MQTYKFHSCALCREAPHLELFTKIPSLPLTLEIALLSHYARFIATGKEHNKDRFES